MVLLEGNEGPMLEVSSPDLPETSDTMIADYTTLRVHVTGAQLGAQLVIVREGDRVAVLDATGADRMLEVPLTASANEDAIRAELWLGVLPLAISSHVYLRPLTEGGGDAGPPDAGMIPVADAGVVEPGGGCGCRAVGSSSPASSVGAMVGLALLVRSVRRKRTHGYKLLRPAM